MQVSRSKPFTPYFYLPCLKQLIIVYLNLKGLEDKLKVIMAIWKSFLPILSLPGKQNCQKKICQQGFEEVTTLLAPGLQQIDPLNSIGNAISTFHPKTDFRSCEMSEKARKVKKTFAPQPPQSPSLSIAAWFCTSKYYLSGSHLS